MAALAAAITSGDAAGVRRLLDHDVTMIVDGGPLELGGEVIGRDATAAELLSSPSDLSTVGINGAPGLVARRDGRVVGTLSAVTRRGLITTIWSVRDSEKLRHWNV